MTTIAAPDNQNSQRPRIEGGTWVFDKDLGCLVPKRGRNFFDLSEKRSDLPAPAVHAGGMTTIKSMADGRFYETKRNYYKSVARAGCEIVGFDKRWDEHVKPPQPFGTQREHEADIVRDVKKSIEQAASRMPPRRYRAKRRSTQPESQ